MSDPVAIDRKPHSPSCDELVMSEGDPLYTCTWPGCKYTSTNSKSFPAHYKQHTGKAAQKRRGKRRIHTDTDIIDRIETGALSILDEAKQLCDALDALRDQIAELEAEITDLGEIKRKAEAYDKLVDDLILALGDK